VEGLSKGREGEAQQKFKKKTVIREEEKTGHAFMEKSANPTKSATKLCIIKKKKKK